MGDALVSRARSRDNPVPRPTGVKGKGAPKAVPMPAARTVPSEVTMGPVTTAARGEAACVRCGCFVTGTL